jgi:hypothetical protein
VKGGRGDGVAANNGFTLDANKLFEDAISALQKGISPWIIFGLVALFMSPWIIPAVSKAIAEHRSLSHKHEISLRKVRNSVSDRSQRKLRGEE